MTSRYKVTVKAYGRVTDLVIEADAYVSTKDGDFTRFTREGKEIHAVRTSVILAIELIPPAEQPLLVQQALDTTAIIRLEVRLLAKEGAQVGHYVSDKSQDEPVYRTIQRGELHHLTSENPGVILHADNMEPFTPAAVAARIQDILTDVTKHDEQIGWRVVAVRPT
jgi:hypothetical protein